MLQSPVFVEPRRRRSAWPINLVAALCAIGAASESRQDQAQTAAARNVVAVEFIASSIWPNRILAGRHCCDQRLAGACGIDDAAGALSTSCEALMLITRL
jgi:hypothetical protein